MREEELHALAHEELEKQLAFRYRILCCGSTPCLSSGADAVVRAFKDELKKHHLDADVELASTGCMGPCSRGPVVTVWLQDGQDIVLERVSPEMVPQIVERLLENRLEQLAAEEHVMPKNLPFFTKQSKVVLVNSGLIDPLNIEHYVARGGYGALSQAIHQMSPEDVCAEMTKSGLRGRGGAGYPSGLKWELVRKSAGEKKFIVANGDEGDPGAYMDRTLMESDPHLVLEGMAIAGYAVGASQGYLYVRGEYPIAAERLSKAIRKAERLGVLGNRILGSNFDFRVDVRIGAGAFVCGEETALMASIMGRRGQPVPRPPYPAQSGLWSSPTLINNVETYGSVAPIIRNGAEWFRSIGTEKSPGTKIFALAGKVANTGLIEVPMGISLREIVFDIGGGIPDKREFKAAQTGGPSGGCIPSEYLDASVDYESLAKLGSIMGSGGLIVMDDRSCMPDVAKFFMDFCREESCGKCVPCRVGTTQALTLLERITNGSGTLQDIEILEELCVVMQETSLCGLGQSAPNPLLSTLRFFRHEYEAHIQEQRCPAEVCKLTELPLAERFLQEYQRQIAEAGEKQEGGAACQS